MTSAAERTNVCLCRRIYMDYASSSSCGRSVALDGRRYSHLLYLCECEFFTSVFGRVDTVLGVKKCFYCFTIGVLFDCFSAALPRKPRTQRCSLGRGVQ